MLIIKTTADIRLLRRRETLGPAYLDHIERFFVQLAASLGDGEPVETFSLETHGYFVVLEPGDGARDLSAVGLTGGLTSSWPEYVEFLDLGGAAAYKVAVLYDNEFMMFFFSTVGQLDAETEAWLKEQAEW